MKEPLFKKPEPEAMVRLLEEDLERVRQELSDELSEERSRRHTLMMRVKRLEDLVHLLTQVLVLVVGFLATYWGLHFYGEGELWGVVGIVSGVAILVMMLREADRNKKKINEREAKED